MIKLSGSAENGDQIIALVIEEGNIQRMRDGKPILIDIGQMVATKRPLSMIIHYSYDIRETAKAIEKEGMEGLMEGSLDKKMNDLVCMVGLPKSGKTTIVRNQYIPRGYAVVCPDDVRLAMHGQRFIESAEPFVWATVYTMVDSLLRAGNKVVVDATHMTEKRREPWRKRGAEFHYVATSKEVCIQRAKDTSDELIIPVIERMDSEFEPLTVQ